MTNDEAAAIVAIQQTMMAYNHAGDGAEMDVTRIFAPDGALEIPGAVFRGHKEVQAFFDGRQEAGRRDIAANIRARHYITTCHIEVTGPGTAEGKTYFLLIRTGQIEQMGTYFDTFRKIGDDWRIAHRNVVLHWMTS